MRPPRFNVEALAEAMAGVPMLRYDRVQSGWEEQVMGRAYNVIDADGHVLEPTTLWD